MLKGLVSKSNYIVKDLEGISGNTNIIFIIANK